MASIQAQLMNQILSLGPKDDPGKPHDYEAERQSYRNPPPLLPEGVTVTELDLNGIHGEKLEKPGNKDIIIFYIHGGGFCTGSALQRRELTQYICDKHGYNCIAIDYRLSPEEKWPAHLEDCHKAYLALLDKGYESSKIAFMGESAGGTLVLSLALLLKEDGLPFPCAIASFSPGTNRAKVYPSYVTNRDSDKMIGHAVDRAGQFEAVFGTPSPKEAFLRSPLVSPYYGDYTGLPPVFLSASNTEILYDDARMLYEKLKSEGHTAAFDVQEELCHAYPIFPHIPEAQETIQKAIDFIAAHSQNAV